MPKILMRREGLLIEETMTNQHKEERLKVVMQVILQEPNMQRDDQPYTIMELVWRQAVLQQGDKILR